MKAREDAKQKQLKTVAGQGRDTHPTQSGSDMQRSTEKADTAEQVEAKQLTIRSSQSCAAKCTTAAPRLEKDTTQ